MRCAHFASRLAYMNDLTLCTDLDTANGQFRFTPPTHAILAFHTALLEHEAEGGVPGRLARYEKNAEVGVRNRGDANTRCTAAEPTTCVYGGDKVCVCGAHSMSFHWIDCEVFHGANSK